MRAHAVRAALAALAIAAAPGVAAADGAAEARRAWYVPDRAKVQLAGNVGFVSPGLGYAGLGGRLEGDLFLGWVPAAIGGTDVWSLTAKATALPVALDLGGFAWTPLTVALQATYTFGDRYFVRPPSRFPGGYYDFPTALRAAVGLGTAVEAAVGARGRRVGAYVELVALDLMLKAWAESPRTLGPAEVFSLALGLRARI